MKISLQKQWEAVHQEERESMIALSWFIGGMLAGSFLAMFCYWKGL